MIKKLLTEEEYESAKNLCNNTLNDFKYDDIVKALDHFTGLVNMVMPDDYIYFSLASDNYFDIEDILEMDSISDEEKESDIKESILSYKDNFKTLAKDILAKIESDKKEAQESGYCYKLMNIPEE